MKYFIRKNKWVAGIKQSWRTLILTFVIGLFATGAWADDKEKGKEIHEALTVKEVFGKIEISPLEILPKSTRLDMLDYMDVDSVYKASNVKEGLSWIESMNDTYMKVRLTTVSSLEIKILPVKKGQVVMTVYTVGSSPQAADSQVEFFDEDLKPLEVSKHLKIPELKDFFEIPKGSLTSMKEIRQMVPFPTVAYCAFPDSDALEARLTVEDYISPDDWNIIKLFVKPEIKAEWKKEKFETWKEK